MDTFSHHGLTFDVTDSGPPDGDAVILLHGFPQDRTTWQDVTPALNAAGLRTLAPDQRGYSPGARPSGVSPYRLGELIGDVLALADSAGAQRFHVVGHDWGGLVAWALAGQHPERVASATVLSTPHPAAIRWSLLHSDQIRRSWYMVTFQLPRLPERRLHAALPRLYRRTGLTDAQADRYTARFPTPESLTPPMNWYRAMPVTRAIGKPLRFAVRRRSGGSRPRASLTVPTTYVWGSRDFALGRAAAEKTAEFVSGDYRFVELEAGHWLPEANAERVAEEILRRARPA